jgi:hypothetical protein
MTILEEYCNDQQCTREDHKLLHSIDKKFNKNPKKFLLTEDEVVYQKIFKDVKDDYTKRDTLRFIKKYKKDLLEEIESVVDLTKIDDDILLEIEKKNKLKKYTILDKKLYFVSGAYKVYGSKVYDLYAKLIRHVYENQDFETEIEFNDKQKIMAKCAGEAYHFSKNSPRYRPESFVDPKYKTVHEYIDGLIGSDYDIDINSGVSIYINQRNTDSCFAPLSNDSTFSEWFDIYLLPVEENMYLPGSHHTNDPTLFPDSCSLYRVGDFGENAITPIRGIQQLHFFSPQTNEPFTIDQIRNGTVLNDPNPNPYFACENDTQTGYNIHKAMDYRKIYNLLFFFLIGSLNQLYWKVTAPGDPLIPVTTSGYDTHPNIAVEPELDSTGKLDTDNKITFYGWDTHAESSAAYMFNYCRGSDVCGICSGNNKDAENICFADKLTRPNAIKSNLPNRNAYPPLTGKERPTGTHSNPGNHLPTFVIVIISVLVVALIVTIIAVAYVKRKKWRENSV